MKSRLSSANYLTSNAPYLPINHQDPLQQIQLTSQGSVSPVSKKGWSRPHSAFFVPQQSTKCATTLHDVSPVCYSCTAHSHTWRQQVKNYLFFARITRQAMYVHRNTEVRSCNHCYSGRAISITHSECVLLVSGIQHKMRMRHFAICVLFGSTTFSPIFNKKSYWT